MKLSECNAKQRKAFLNIVHAANWIIGGLENTVADCDPDDKDRIDAEKALANHAVLVNGIYEAATTDIYTDGAVKFGKGAESYLKDIRFCGKAWLMERVEARVKKLGY